MDVPPRPRVVSAFGCAPFVFPLTAGYATITFVQVGRIDLGTRLVGSARTTVSRWMRVLALELLDAVPIGGGFATPAVLRAGFDAAFITYFGLQAVEPAHSSG